MVPSSRGSPIYTSVHSSASAGPQSYTGTMPSWAFPRASFIPSPRWQSPSNYAPMIVPQGLVQVPSWNSYPVSSFGMVMQCIFFYNFEAITFIFFIQNIIKHYLEKFPRGSASACLY